MTAIRQLNPRAALLAVAIAVILVAVATFAVQSSPIPALAQSNSVAPTNVAVRNGANTGEAVVTWTPNVAAVSNRVGWASISEVQAARDAGNWLEAFNFVEIGGAKNSYTVKRPEPGDEHAFIVATITANRAYTYSAWVFHTTAAAPALPPCVTPGSGGQQPTPAPDDGDYDVDNDGLIEVASLAQLDAMRNDLDGDGRGLGSDYAAAFPNARPGMGCPDTGCGGYELTADLDFDTNGDGRVDGRDAYWAGGLGWLPIGGAEEGARWSAVFDGGGHTIANLFVATEDIQEVGLFGVIGAGGTVSNVALTSVSVSGPIAGGLAGIIYGAVSDVSVAGQVSSNAIAGGLVGLMGGSASLTGSHAAANVAGNGYVGGVVGEGRSSGSGAGVPKIESSYATGTVTAEGGGVAGGLVGSFPGAVKASYATGAVSVAGSSWGRGRKVERRGDAGGLVGTLSGSVTAGYATGPVDGYAAGGGLVGVSYGGRVADSYATGLIATRTESRGGLVGRGVSHSTVTDSFWDTQSSGTRSSTGGIGKTTREMQDTGIYSGWDPAWWDFGTQDQYPALKYRGMSVAAQR